MDLIFNEDIKQFELAKQPYKTVEIRCEIEEDYNDFEKLVSLSQPKKPKEVLRTGCNNKSVREALEHNYNRLNAENQIPVPKYREWKATDYQCPNCNALTKEGEPNYCWNCGQKLDWEKIND